MRKLEIIEHISLDGEIQASDDDGDFPYGDWTAPYRTPADREEIIAAHGESFDLLLGRRTYDIWSGFWPKAPHTFCKATGFKLNRLDLADGDLLFGPVVKFGGPQKLLCSHVLGMLKPASVLQVNRHTGCARGVTPDRRPGNDLATCKSDHDRKTG